MPLVSTKRHSVSHFIFEHLRDSIYRGELRIGETLDPEEDLAALMEVDCHHVNQAVTLLIENGYARKGDGPGYVVTLPETPLRQDAFPYALVPRQCSLDELMEVRIGLEGYGVGLAVERADERDIHFLRRAQAELAQDPPSKVQARDADIKFHMAIALATHNSVYVDMVRRFYEHMFDSINELHEMLYENPANLDIIDQHHLKILDAIETREKEDAQRYMLQHIVFLRAFIRDRSAKA